ncbi:MAG: hypothetical protein ACE5DM_06080 [Candidatus Nanoarchaeia archaeon]
MHKWVLFELDNVLRGTKDTLVQYSPSREYSRELTTKSSYELGS